MESLEEFTGQKLIWVQSKAARRGYTLTDGDGVLATLTWTKIMGTLAVAEYDGKKYSFKRIGFLHPLVTVRKLEFEEDLAFMRLSFGGNGVLEFHDGSRYVLQKMSFWKNQWRMSDSSGRTMCTFIPSRSFVRHTGEVTLSQEELKDGHLPMLIVLGWYVIVLITEESESAAVVTVTTPYL
jgi:hypothetical protein